MQSRSPRRRNSESARSATRCFFNRPFPPDSNENQDWRIGSSLANAHNRFDLLQRRINATERNYHRSLKALLALEPLQSQPETTESTTTFEELASFPQIQKTPSGEAAAPPPDPLFTVPNTDLPHKGDTA